MYSNTVRVKDLPALLRRKAASGIDYDTCGIGSEFHLKRVLKRATSDDQAVHAMLFSPHFGVTAGCICSAAGSLQHSLKTTSKKKALSSLGSTAVTNSRYDLSPSSSAGCVHDKVNSEGPVFRSFLNAGGAGNSTRRKSQAAIHLLNWLPIVTPVKRPNHHSPYTQ